MPVLGRALRKGLNFVSSSESRPWLWASGAPTAAGKQVGPANAMTAGAVYSAVRINSQTVAQLPIHFLERGDVTRTPVEPPQVRALWTQPNPDQVRITFMETVVMSLMLWGNFYGATRYNRDRELVECWPIAPDRITEIRRVDERGDLLSEEKLKTYEGRLGTAFRIDDYGWLKAIPGSPPEILHIPWMTLPGQVRGMSPIEWHAEQIGMSLSAQEHAARFLGEDSATISGTITTDAELDDDEAKELWENFQRRHAGPRGAGKVGVLTAGAKFVPITIPPNQLQFLEQMQYSDRKIASIFGVPPHMVGDTEKTTSWGTGIEEQKIGHTANTIVPIVERIEQYVEARLLPPDIQMRMQVNGLLRGSVRDRAEFYRVLWSLGAINEDEIRAFEDMAPLPDGMGSRYWVPLNVAPIDATIEDLESRFRATVAAGASGSSIAPVLPAPRPGMPDGGA